MKQSLKNKIENIISNPNASEEEMLFQLRNLLETKAKRLDDLTSEKMNLLKKGSENRGAMKTGFKELDNVCGGFLPGELIVIGGRPGMGKSQLMVNLALNMSVAAPVLYFSFDTPQQQLSARFISTVTFVESYKLLRNELIYGEMGMLEGIEQRMKKYKLFINDNYFSTYSAFKEYCENQINENGVQVIMVDSLQTMNSKFRGSRKMSLNAISNELKNLAKDNNVCVLLTSQLSRAVETRGGSMRPHLADLQDRGAMEQNADKVIFIYRPEYYGLEIDELNRSTAGVVNLIIAKNKDGKRVDVLLKRNWNFTSYHDFNSSPNKLPQIESRQNEIEFPELAQ